VAVPALVVIPAKAGTQAITPSAHPPRHSCEARHPSWFSPPRPMAFEFHAKIKMGPGLRRDDGDSPMPHAL